MFPSYTPTPLIGVYFAILVIWLATVIYSSYARDKTAQRIASFSSYLFFWVGTPISILEFGFIGSWVWPLSMVVSVGMLMMVENIFGKEVYGK